MSVPPRLLCLLVLSTLICSMTVLASAQESPPGFWTTLPPAPTKRTEVAAAAVGGKIYVVGGFNQPALGNLMDLAITPTTEEYDPLTKQWSTKTPLPIGVHHAGIGVVGEKLYVIGGFTKSFLSVWHPAANVFEYDPKADRWTERAPMPTPRGALAVAELAGKLVAIGGYDGSGNSPAVEEYDPADNSWHPKPPLPTPRDHLAAATIEGRIYAIAGRLNRDYQHNLAVVEIYDPKTDQWSQAPDLPTPRSGITAGVIGERIYVLGGEAPEGTFATNEAYAPGENHWQTMAPMPTPRHGLGSAVVNQRLYVISGGPKPGGSFSNVNEMFEPRGQPTSRATPTQVGTIMALLATFDAAGLLPPQPSPEADRLIRILIQSQAALMKSNHPAVRRLLQDALTTKLADAAASAAERFRSDGWTSESLEAVVDYITTKPVWEDEQIEAGLRPYHIGRADLDFLSYTFQTARTRLAAAGHDVHAVYASRRREMPGGGL